MLEAVVVRRGKTGLLIELPAMDKTELDAVADRVSDLGNLEMRIMASNVQYDKNDVSYDLEKAKEEFIGLARHRQQPQDVAPRNRSTSSSSTMSRCAGQAALGAEEDRREP